MRNLAQIFTTVILCLFLGACGSQYSEERVERWIGYWSFPNDSIEFPIFFELQLRKGFIVGESLETDGDVAKISGEIKDGVYSLLLHPIKHGEKTNQDVIFEGTRVGEKLNGQWKHHVGVVGPWGAKITQLDAETALRTKLQPCESNDSLFASSSCAERKNDDT